MEADKHYSLKCYYCLRCVREAYPGENRRDGCQITFWTKVGLFTVTLCGDCRREHLPSIQVPEE